jgi:CheY-like chemotaxis protein
MRAILIAEDAPDTREVVRAALARSGHQLYVAADGNEAWELLRCHQPQVAVLDVQMPGRTGLELVQMIRADPELRRTYIILLTGEKLERDVLAGQGAGANRYFIKPFSVQGLTDAVAQGFELADALEPVSREDREGW